jgi:hypothetical protein
MRRRGLQGFPGWQRSPQSWGVIPMSERIAEMKSEIPQPMFTSVPFVHPMPFCLESHLIAGPSAIAVNRERASVRVFHISFSRRYRRRNWLETFRALEQEHVDKRL